MPPSNSGPYQKYECRVWADAKQEALVLGPMVISAQSQADAVILVGDEADRLGLRWFIATAEVMS
jgi:hypothetical protein